MPTSSTLRERLADALWGLFAADALAMPVHWFYDRGNIREEFAGGITGYEAARHPHPEAFMVGMDYRPDVAEAGRHDRPWDILGEHARFYRTSYTGDPSIALTDTGSEHGNRVAGKDERYHYHHGLGAGENTLGAQLLRVLLRSVAARGVYDQDDFLARFVAFMTTTEGRRDPYTEIYLRRWFEKYSRGLPPEDCAGHQRAVWSIGSLGGMPRPLVVALLGAGAGEAAAYQATGMALEHQGLTHRSENVAAAVAVAASLLLDLVRGADPRGTLRRHASRVRPPRVTGHELQRAYRDAGGPGNIPATEMWRLHTELADEAIDLEARDRQDEDDVILGRFATACYPEHGLPLALWLAHRHLGDTRAALLANANAGGDNVHRGMVLGLLAGAAGGVPDDLKAGLADHDALAAEIDGFVGVAAGNGAVY